MFNDKFRYTDATMPPASDPLLRSVRQKQKNGIELTMSERFRAGRDDTVKEIYGRELKPDYVYRAIGQSLLDIYWSKMKIIGAGKDDEYIPGQNNKGVDWYLGAAAPKYGDIILEAPAHPQYFTPADQYGLMMAKDPTVRHMKSSGHSKPVPLALVEIIIPPDGPALPEDHMAPVHRIY